MASEATKTDDGGPAFPVAEDHRVADSIPWTCGMTLRDYFAAAALTGLLSDSERDTIWAAKPTPAENDAERDAAHLEKAEFAYRYADAMLSARKAVSP